MRLTFLRLDRDLPAPRSAVAGDAGIDLLAREGGQLSPRGGRAVFGTGIAVALPPGQVGLVMPRSGLAAHSGITVLNAPGVIDSGYRGEIKVVLINTGADPYVVARSDRIAQLLVVPIAECAWEEVDQLPSSARGVEGLGHSGA